MVVLPTYSHLGSLNATAYNNAVVLFTVQRYRTFNRDINDDILRSIKLSFTVQM